MLICSRKLFLKKFRVHFSEASDKPLSKNEPQVIHVGSHVIVFSYKRVNFNILPYGENMKYPFLKLLE